MFNTFLHFAIFVYQHKVRLSQGQNHKILFGIHKHVYRQNNTYEKHEAHEQT